MSDMKEPQADSGLPECPLYIAHPQSVWFEEHWRPIFQRLLERLEIKQRYVETLERAFQNGEADALAVLQAEVDRLTMINDVSQSVTAWMHIKGKLDRTVTALRQCADVHVCSNGDVMTDAMALDNVELIVNDCLAEIGVTK